MIGFDIMKQLGKGAFGSVFLVKRREDNQIYALKRVFLDKLGKKEQDNSINEVRLLASINHKNIIGYKESSFDDVNKCLNIVMEYADDGDLQSKIEFNKKHNLLFDERTIWSYAIQMVRGLKALHDCKIMHRDLKTANIFLMKNGLCKLGDLNVSKVVKMGMLHTQTGTPYYASPEVWNDKPYSYKSDLWSIGCVIYELCTMRVPFKGKNMDDLYQTVCRGRYGPLPDIYSKELSQMISLLLKVNASERPSCEQFLSHPIILRRIIIGRMDDNNDVGKKADLLGTIKFRDIKEIKQKLPKKNYDDE